MTHQALYAAVTGALRPDPILTPDEWADAHRYLTSAETRRPGQWDTDIVPFAREPMQRLALHDPCPAVVLMFAAQIVKTEVGLNWLGYLVDCAPCPIMVLMPSVEVCEGYSKQRLRHLFAVPRLRGKVASEKSRESSNTILLKEFDGGLLVLAGSNAPSRLASWPIRCLHEDEVDRYATSAGKEGDPSSLARKRQSSFGDRAKRLTTSTPTVEGASRIASEYEGGTQADWEMPCPHCGTFQTLVWQDDEGDFRIRWEGDPGETDGFSVWYDCAHCHERIEEASKGNMLAQGVWVHKHPGRVVPSYRLSSISAPVGAVTWRTLVGEWVEAHARAKVGDFELLKTFVNTRLAQTWEDRGEVVDAGPLEARCEDWGDTIPDGVRVLTCGVDVQDDRLEVEVMGWGRGLESWSIETQIIPTDPLDEQTWEDLDEILEARWTRADGGQMAIVSTCVDSGYRTQQVYDFCNARAKRHVYAIKGDNGKRPIWDPKIRKGRAKTKGGQGRFHIVGVDTAKDAVAAYLRVTEPGPKYCHFPAGRAPEYFAQLTAERKVTKRDQTGRRVRKWMLPSGARNEALDTRVYNMAALYAAMARGKRIKAAIYSDAPAPAAARRRPPPPAEKKEAPPQARRQQARRPQADDWSSGRGRGRGRADDYFG